MANTTGVTEGSKVAGVAVAERVAAEHSLWLSSLPTIRRAPISDMLPQLLGGAELEPLTEPIAAPVMTVARTLAVGHGPSATCPSAWMAATSSPPTTAPTWCASSTRRRCR